MPIFNLSTAKNRITKNGGPALRTQFTVQVFGPPVDKFVSQYAEYLSLMAVSTTIPALNIMTYEHTDTTHTVKYPYNKMLDDHTITFLSTQKTFLERKFFESWISSIISYYTNDIGFRSEYASDMYIYQLDARENIIHSSRLVSAYPIAISSQSLDYTSMDTYQSFDVTFTYKYLYVEASSSVDPNAVTSSDYAYEFGRWQDSTYSTGPVETNKV